MNSPRNHVDVEYIWSFEDEEKQFRSTVTLSFKVQLEVRAGTVFERSRRRLPQSHRHC